MAVVQFSEEKLNKVKEIIARYPEGKQKSALIPVLHLAQEAFGGWLSAETMDYVATLLQLQSIEVYVVATFYSMFNLKPVGKHVLEVCRTGPCMLRGADHLIEHLENRLGCHVGETSADGLFTLKTVECLAACGMGPMLQIREKYYENLDPQKMDQLLDDLSKA